MKNKYIVNDEIMNELENISARYEQLRNFIDFMHGFVWDKIIAGYEGETIERLGCFTEMLSEVAHIRNDDLGKVIKKIAISRKTEEPDKT